MGRDELPPGLRAIAFFIFNKYKNEGGIDVLPSVNIGVVHFFCAPAVVGVRGSCAAGESIPFYSLFLENLQYSLAA